MNVTEVYNIIKVYATPGSSGTYTVYADATTEVYTDKAAGEFIDLLKALQMAKRLSNNNFVEVWGDDILVTGEPKKGLTPYGPR